MADAKIDSQERDTCPADRKPPESFKQQLQQFSHGVSATGLRYVFDDDVSIYRRIIWGVLVACGLLYSFYQIGKSIHVYASRPVAVSIDLSYRDELEFPVVTFCNENVIKKSAMPQQGFEDYVRVIRMLVGGVSSPLDRNMTEIDALLDGLDVQLLQEVLETGMYHQDEIMRQCWWRGQPCEQKYVTSVYTDMGLCFSFNANGSSPLIARDTSGHQSGLRLLLDAQQHEYVASREGTVGFRVMLHSPYETPVLQARGFKVGPGMHILTSVSKSVTHRLGSPYSQCRQVAGDASEHYSYYACLQECENAFVEGVCGCHNLQGRNVARVCTEKTELQCLMRLMQVSSAFDRRHCKCPTQCRDIDYTPSTSFSPFANYLSAMMINATADYVTNNLLLLDIYFTELEENVITSVPAYTFVALMADIGGSLSLFLGSGLFTIFEVVDFAIVAANKKRVARNGECTDPEQTAMKSTKR
ncbi:PREDICTED: acid-sensing ion channel 1-like [Priapulus caudatus]|uniref:Acid-sensing ion channel 1-like n=1 Tax=Priapulus caudatus TaxID=37621 RepID=A0ABM1EFH8_PRICU|nr:PREDICTED: acid-sensing ion channel 1-like [Priapulus caudatus]